MSQSKLTKPVFPPQHQDKQPGVESEMNPLPLAEDINYLGSGKLEGKVALITGGDSGIGRAVAIAFAKEGADIAIVYRDEHSDAEATQSRIQMFSRAALPHLKSGAVIINTASITDYQGADQLIDYSASKGAVVAFTRSLSESLSKQGVRVNGVAPGPTWTPLIPSSFPAEQVATFGSTTPMQRAGQPKELAPAYVFLASNDSSYMSGQILHVNGGTIING